MATGREKSGPLLLLDGMSLAFRAYFALPDTLATSTGMVTNAVHGFTSMVVYLIREQHPSALAVAFDAPGPTFRDEMLEDYKAGRAQTPWLLPPQFDMIREVMASLAIPVVEAPGFEADDVIATLATEAAERQSRGRHRDGRPGQLPADHRPLHPGALQQARRERLRALRRGRDHGALRRATVQVRAAGLAAGRPVGQPARRARRGGEDGGQAADQVRRPRRRLLASGRADAQAAREPDRAPGAGPLQCPRSSRWCATCPSRSRSTSSRSGAGTAARRKRRSTATR